MWPYDPKLLLLLRQLKNRASNGGFLITSRVAYGPSRDRLDGWGYRIARRYTCRSGLACGDPVPRIYAFLRVGSNSRSMYSRALAAVGARGRGGSV